MRSIAGRRVAVLGGTGFIGSHLVERLVVEGAEVLAVARTDEHVDNLAAARGECVVGIADVCDGAGLQRTLTRFRAQTVFHLAAHPDGHESFAQVSECMRVNGIGLVNALEASAAAGATEFVYGASAKDYGNAAVPYRASQAAQPVCSYAIVKSAGWELCRLAASFTPLKVVALRPTFVYGPRQGRNVITHVQECIARRQPVRLMGGSQTRDPLFIDDAVSAFVAAALSTQGWGHAIPIGGGQELTVSSLCEAVLSAAGTSLPVQSGAHDPRPTEIWRSSSDNVDAFRLLGWEPRVSLWEGLTRTVAGWVSVEARGAALPVRPRPDCYLATSASGRTFRMLDRRDLARGTRATPGRRKHDPRIVTTAPDPAHAPSLRRQDLGRAVVIGERH